MNKDKNKEKIEQLINEAMQLLQTAKKLIEQQSDSSLINGYPRLRWDYNVSTEYPVIQGTRSTVDQLTNLCLGGWSEEDIDDIASYSPSKLTREDFREAITYMLHKARRDNSRPIP